MFLSKVPEFLNKQFIINFLFLNKEINKKLTKRIYKNLLQKLLCDTNNINDLTMRISIWKILLKVKEIKEKYPYIPNRDKVHQFL